RPRGAEITRSARCTARATVSSALPPSTTITLTPRRRSGSSRRSVASTAAASFRVGTMIASRIVTLPRRRSSLHVVERPVVFEERDRRLFVAQPRTIFGRVGQLLGIARCHVGDARESFVSLLKVLAVPVEDTRDFDRLGLGVVPIARAIRHEVL